MDMDYGLIRLIVKPKHVTCKCTNFDYAIATRYIGGASMPIQCCRSKAPITNVQVSRSLL